MKSPRSPKRSRAQLVSSIVGSIQQKSPIGNRGRLPYGRVSNDDLDSDGGDTETDGLQVQEQELPTIGGGLSHDRGDFRNFSIDDDDEEQCRSSMKGESSTPVPHSQQNSTARPPQNYICPLTLQLMEDPVHDGCGHTFERRAIVEWLESHRNSRDVNEAMICPISRKPLLRVGGVHRFQYDQTTTEHPDTTPQHNNTYEGLLKSDPGLQRRIAEWKSNHPGARRPSATIQHTDCAHMLLPQEQKVLRIVQTRARLRKEQMERSGCIYNKCFVSSVVLVGVFLLVASYVLFVDDRHRTKGV